MDPELAVLLNAGTRGQIGKLLEATEETLAGSRDSPNSRRN